MLDNSSRVPLYYQLVEYVVGQIQSGQWRAGDRVPSEGELGQQFHVSRTTVRTALSELKNQGLISRIQGKGTFIIQPRIQQRLNRLTGFTSDMQARGLIPSSKIIAACQMPVPSLMASSLQIKTGHPIYLIKRLRLADGTPMAVETSYLHSEGCDGLLDENLDEASLYHLLAEKYCITPTRAAQEMDAEPCPGAEAKLLGVRKGSPGAPHPPHDLRSARAPLRMRGVILPGRPVRLLHRADQRVRQVDEMGGFHTYFSLRRSI